MNQLSLRFNPSLSSQAGLSPAKTGDTPGQYTDEFKEQILAECQEVGNVALVARRHQISENTIYTWIKKMRKNCSLKPLPKAEKQRLEELEKRLKAVSTENDWLKRLLAEKELELAILRELRDRVNPR